MDKRKFVAPPDLSPQEILVQVYLYPVLVLGNPYPHRKSLGLSDYLVTGQVWGSEGTSLLQWCRDCLHHEFGSELAFVLFGESKEVRSASHNKVHTVFWRLSP